MLSAEDNELISRIGPGTLMGDLMRQYWVPAMLSSEVPEPDSEPIRIMLLGEQLIGFRDTSGHVGLISDLCPHRGASLFFGRNEENGIRCVYHGWKFDASGNCVDMPNESAESNFKSRVKANAYPCRERGGVVWAYLGSRDTLPPLPDLEANQLPGGQWSACIIQRECNWLQALEGDIDTSHLGFLHLGDIEPEDLPAGSFDYYTVKDRTPRYVALDTPYGAMYGAYRASEPGYLYWRVAQFLFPFYTHIPTGLLGREIRTRCWVPMDDTHTMYFMLAKRPAATGSGEAPGSPTPSTFLENTTDWFGRARYEANGGNDYLIDREGQRTKRSFTGLQTIHLQDQAVTESMGPVLNRALENLGSADVMVIRVRMRLLEAALAFREKGIVPPGVDNPEIYQVRSGGAFLPAGQDWLEGIEDLLPAYVEHPELNPNLDARELRRIRSKPAP